MSTAFGVRVNRITTRGLTEGAIQAALVTLLALATNYVPLIGTVTAFLVPLPLTVLVIRQGIPPALLAAFVAGAIAGLVAGPLAGLAILITFAPSGILMGLGARRGWSGVAILGATAAAAVVSIAGYVGLTLAISGVNPVHATIEAMRQSQEASLSLYRRLGINPQVVEPQAKAVRDFLYLLPSLIPLLLVVAGLGFAWLNLQVARPILRRLGYQMPGLPPATTWRIPAIAVWLLPVAMVLLWLGGGPGVAVSDHLRTVSGEPRLSVPSIIGLNLQLMFFQAFTIQGILVGWVFLRRYILAPAVRVLILIFSVVNPLLALVIIMLGMADSIFPLRERWAPAPVAPEDPA